MKHLDAAALRELGELVGKMTEGQWSRDAAYGMVNEDGEWMFDGAYDTDEDALVALRNAAPSLLSMAGKWLEARETIENMANAGRSLDDERLGYVEMQIDRRDLEAAAALLKDSEEGE